MRGDSKMEMPPSYLGYCHLVNMNDRTRMCQDFSVDDLRADRQFDDLSPKQISEIIIWYRRNQPSVQDSVWDIRRKAAAQG